MKTRKGIRGRSSGKTRSHCLLKSLQESYLGYKREGGVSHEEMKKIIVDNQIALDRLRDKRDAVLTREAFQKNYTASHDSIF